MPKEILTFYRNGEKLENNTQTQGKTCLVPVSMNQLYLTGKPFANLASLILSSGFKSVTISLADGLLIYNGYTVTGYQQEAKTWKSKNADAITQLEKILGKENTKIQDWNSSLSSKNFDTWKQIILKDQEDPDFKKALYTTISKKAKKPVVEVETLFKTHDELVANSYSYLIEEGAVFLDWLESKAADFIIYPKPITTFFKYLSKKHLFSSEDYYLEAKIISLCDAKPINDINPQFPLEMLVKYIIKYSPDAESAGQTLASFYKQVSNYQPDASSSLSITPPSLTSVSTPISLLASSIAKGMSGDSPRVNDPLTTNQSEETIILTR